ncbi:hypothetical protein IJ384_02710 [bacterium]|nr:hypothetical protein [bacterium]
MHKNLKKLLGFSLVVATVAGMTLPAMSASIVADAITVETQSGESPYESIIVQNGGKVTNSLDISAQSVTTQAIADVIENSAVMNIESLSNMGKIQNNGELVATGAFTNSGVISGNSGILTINGGTNAVGANIEQGIVNVNAALTNSSIIKAATKLTNTGGITNNASIEAQYLENNGTITGDSGSLTIINGGFSNSNIVQNNISIGGSFANNAFLEAKDSFENNGTIQNNSTIKVGTLINNTTISGNGDLLISNGGESSGAISQKVIEIIGDFTNTGTLNATEKLTNANILTNSNEITVSELINSGSIVGDTGNLAINNGGINSSAGVIRQNEVSIKGAFENAGVIEAINSFTNKGTITNSNSIKTNYLTNTGTIKGDTGSLIIGGGTNSGTIVQNKVEINSGIFENKGSITANDEFINNTAISGTGSLTLKGGGESNDTITQKNLTLSGVDKTFTNKSSIKLTDRLTTVAKNTLTNNSTITTSSITHRGDIDGTGSLTVSSGTSYNYGNITQNSATLGGTFYNYAAGNISAKTLNLSSGANVTNQGSLGVAGNAITNRATVSNTGTITGSTLNNIGKITNGGEIKTSSTFTNSGTLINNKTISTGAFTNSGALTNTGSITTSGNFTNNGNFTNSGANAVLNSMNFSNNKTFTLDNGASASLKTITNNATNGVINIQNGSSLVLTNQTSVINGTINALTGENTMDLGNSVGFNGTLNIGEETNVVTYNLTRANGTFDTILNLTGGDISADAKVNLASNTLLVIDSANSEVTFSEEDFYNGGVEVKDGMFTAENITINAIKKPTRNPNEPYYTQSGGTLNLVNSTLKSEEGAFTGGDIVFDSLSVYESKDGGFNLSSFKSSGELSAKNTINEDFYMTNMIIGDNSTGDNELDITLDIYGRSNAEGRHGSDRFITENIKADDGLESAIINVTDWTLSGELLGKDAPIDKHIQLGQIFAGNIADNVELNVLEKEVFTPIGWYKLQNSGGIMGNYSLSLTRINPQVYRGQVATVAQHQNQLAINDMLFNHTMLLPSYREYNNRSLGLNANKYAADSPLYAPYQYTAREGGLWCKMYGIFERLKLDRGFDVGNNAYGALIGADFGLREIKNGWNYLPTVYLGYNGAHQTFKGTGAYQNGGQIGFLGTLYKDDFVIGGLAYGGVYDNSMDIADGNEKAFNHFLGLSTKAAYNWHVGKNTIIQPNLLVAYNYFGQQNWHSDFGEMSMQAGVLNGFNIAPGFNLIWEKESYSLYATLQYMFNVYGQIDGRAGNVQLEDLCMDRGYIQYGFGINKSLTDRSSGYFQTTFRNIGRNGVGFQLGYKYLLGW